MKRVFLIILNKIAIVYFYGWFMHKLNSLSTNQTIVFIDIDNTIADTWPSLVNNVLKPQLRHRQLAVHEGMKAFVIENYLSVANIQVVYLSVRNVLLFGTTQQWLLKHQFASKTSGLILVQNPQQKLYFLKKAVQKKSTVICVDDLSYNHENGRVYFYNEVIARVKEMPIKYIGFDKINAINNDFQNIKRNN